MATTIILKPIQLKIRLLDAISSSHHKIQSLSPISDHLLPAASSLSGFLPFSSLGAFTTSYLCLFSVLTVPQPSFKVLLFTDASSATFPYYMHGVSCVPCVLHPVPCVLCAIHPPRPSPTPHLLSITHCFFVTRAGNGVISSNFFSSILLFLLRITILFKIYNGK